MKDLIRRAITGAIYVAILVACIFGGIYSFACLFTLITIFCLWEFYGLVNMHEEVFVIKSLNVLSGAYLFIATFLFIWKDIGFCIYLPYILYILLVFILEMYRKKPNPVLNWAYSFLGQVYIALPIALLNRIAFFPDSNGVMSYIPLILFSLFVFIWVNDTGAYLLGVTFGKHRLFERISPKKSWEGFWGGLVLAILSSMIFGYFLPDVGYLHWAFLALLVVLAGTFGDLVESMMKRTFNVKDSGNALPGHGGFLDRFDSMLFAIYAMFIYIEIVLR